MIPKGVWVLGKYWTVEAKVGFYRNEECFGDTIHPQLRIRVDSEMSLQQTRDTLLHEIIHAIEKELGLTMSEKTVKQLSTTLLAVLRGNPSLMTFLLSEAEDNADATTSP